MFLNTRASSGAGPKAAASIGRPRRLAFAVSLTVLLAGAEVPAGGDDGPMASAPLPPPLPAAPPAAGLPQPQREPSAASRPVLSQSRPRAETGGHIAQPHKRSGDTHAVDRFGRDPRGQKRLGQRAVGDGELWKRHAAPQVANSITPPPAPLPFPYGYFPGTAPAYGYALVYPPLLPPGPVLPH